MQNQTGSYELNILIGGRPITEYSHEGNTFVEGRKGSEFEVEFKNKTGKQILVVPSVDGKSVFDGKPATPDSQGYVIRPYGKIRIPGWTLDNSAVAKFTFEDKDKSYSAAVTQEGEAVVSGVIGVIVFAEKQKPNHTTVIHHHHTYPVYPSPTVYPKGPHTWPYNGPTWTTSGIAASDVMNSSSKSVFRSMSSDTATLSASATNSATSEPSVETSFDMGAGFGQKSDFHTSTVSFDRGDILTTLVLYYDSRKNLEKRGIEIVKKEQRYLNELPQPFMGMGCTPPPGWTG
jgi:hypothetical protein